MNLRRLREGAGLSQEDLMHLADVHRTQISCYERGETEPQAEVVARLSRALGVSAEEFFAGIRWQGWAQRRMQTQALVGRAQKSTPPIPLWRSSGTTGVPQKAHLTPAVRFRAYG